MEYQLLHFPEKISHMLSSAAREDLDRRWEIGHTIENKYRIEDVIASDDRKIIHKVRHLQWNIPLAVRSQLDRHSQVQFFHQAERWVELGKHPNVVSAYYVQNIGGVPRLFVEYVKSKTLDRFAKTEKYDLADVLDIAIQICWGMAHAHRKGMLHGDLRPANVFVTEEGEVKITDFRSREGAVAQYTPYMAPEQFERNWVAAPADDIYAFGVMLYELCVAELPFKVEGELKGEESLESFKYLILTQQPRIPHKVDPEIPRALSDLILQCLSVNVDERPRYFDDVAEKLQKIYGDMTIFQYPRTQPDPSTLTAVDLNNRALSLLDLNQTEEAEEYLKEAVDANPLCPGPLINLHLLRLRRGKGSLARVRAATQKLLEFDREVATFYRSRISLERGGFLREALEEVSVAVAKYPQNRELLRLKGIVLERLTEYDKAIEVFAELCSSPSLPDIYRLVFCYLESGKKKKALEFLEQWRSAYADTSQFTILLAVTSALQGKLDESYHHFQRMGGGDFWALLNLAEITAAFGEYVRPYSKATPAVAEAQKLYEKLILQAPRLPRVRRGYQHVFSRVPEVNPQDVKAEILPHWSYTRTLEGYHEGIHSMALSPDGRMALIGGEDPMLMLWDIATGACRNKLEGHPDGTTQVIISHDGHFAVASGRDNIVLVWDLITGECVEKLEGHVRDVTCFALTTTGYLVTGSLDRTLRVWDFGARSCKKILKGHNDKINCLAVTPAGDLAISGSEDRRIGIWEIERGSVVEFLEGHSDGVTYVAVSPNGKWLISGGWDQKMRIYEIASRKCVAVLAGHTGTLNCIQITPDSRLVISGSEDKSIRVWEIPSGKCLFTLTGHTVDVTCLAVAPHSNFVVSGSWDHTVRVWDIHSGECMAVLEEHTDLVHTVAITPDERFILSGGDDPGVKIWCDLTTLACPIFQEPALSYLLQRPISEAGNLEGQRKVEKLIVQAEAKSKKDEIGGLLDIYRQIQEISGFERNQRVLGVVSRTAREHRLTRRRPRSIWQHKLLREHRGGVTCLAMAPHNNAVISGSKDQKLKIWDIETGECLATLEGHEGPVSSIDVSPNGRFVVSGSGDKTLRLWELETGRCIYKMEGHKYGVEYAKFTPDGRRIISASRDSQIRIWERKTGHRIYSLTSHTDLISALQISSDNNSLISGSHDRTIRVWELESGRCSKTLEKHSEHVKCLAAVPNSPLILSGGWDSAIYLWDIREGECLKELMGHRSWVNEICVTDDGKVAVSCSLDKTVRVWEIESGKCLAVLEGHKEDVNHITVTTDGHFCISSSWDNTLRVWDLNTYESCGVLQGHTDVITSLQPDPSHRYVITGSKDQTVIIWEFDWNWQ